MGLYEANMDTPLFFVLGSFYTKIRPQSIVTTLATFYYPLHIIFFMMFTFLTYLQAFLHPEDLFNSIEGMILCIQVINRWINLILFQPYLELLKTKTETFQDFRHCLDAEIRERCAAIFSLGNTGAKILKGILVIFLPAIYFGAPFSETGSVMANFYAPPNTPYIWIYLFQSFALTNMCCVSVGSDLVIANLLAPVTIQFILLQKELSELNLKNVSDTGTEHKFLRKKLYKLVDRHNFLIGCVEDYKNFVSVGFFINFALTILCCCIELYKITNNPNMVAAFESIIYMCGTANSIVFIYSLPAQTLINEAERINDVIWELKWYLPNLVHVRKVLLFMMTRSQKLLKLKACQLIDINIKTTLYVLKTIWTVYTFLQHVTGKETHGVHRF